MTQTLVLGPPGCGKTTFLLNTVQQEMADGIHPSRIAYVSFTRKAAGEAVTRALDKFNAKRPDFPYFRTLHSLAFQEQGIGRDDVMQAKDYKQIGHALGLTFSDYMDFEEGLPVSAKDGDQVLYIVSMARATLRSVEEQYRAYLQGEVAWHRVKQFADTLAAYKHDTGRLDFSDMLDGFVTNCQPLDIDVAFIDEAQDLSKQQWRMVRHATSKAKRVYIAGDDDQAIYRWSGADVDTFLGLEGTRRVLNQSYRLPRKVHHLCSRISARISRRFDKTWAPRDEDGAVDFIASLPDLEWREGSYLFLARNRYLLEQAHCYLRTSGMPYTSGRDKSTNDPDDVAAIVAWERLRRGEAQPAAAVRVVYGRMETGKGVKRGFKRLANVADDAMLTLADLEQSGGLLRTDPWHEALDRIKPEDREFYQAVLRRREKLTKPPRVHLSTIHGAKGGEADNVVLISDMAARTYAELRNAPDDEHRVAYVGASRARQRLCILLPQSGRSYDYRA